jgi:ubiquinone/menaquinone biosynthesis C-methylase UbiE
MPHIVFKKNTKVKLLPESNIFQVGPRSTEPKIIESFYTKNPFPNYETFDTIYDLVNTLKKNKLISSLKSSLGYNKRIIEVGSGTSQLSIALSINTNLEVVAFDTTLASLKLGSDFSAKHKINNCMFVNGDISSDSFMPNYFDLVWCSGVLHHTEDAEKEFKTIIKWARPHGYVVVGLYNFYGRMRTIFRQVLYRLLGKSKFGKSIISLLDPVLRSRISKQKKEAWFCDQYEHPIESLHTLDEVLQWFDTNSIEFISSVPTCDISLIDYNNLFFKQSRGNIITRLISQILMTFSRSGSEGGLFLVIGKKTCSSTNDNIAAFHKS